MKGNMTVTMDENFMIFMLKEVMNKSRMARGMKGIAYAIALPAAICCILMELMVWRLEGEFSISWILLLATSMLLFAFTVGGYKEFYLRRCRKELKKIQFPIQQIIEFDEDMFLRENSKRRIRVRNYLNTDDNNQVIIEDSRLVEFIENKEEE